ncbi:GNAT family N-acetyltransferase [Geodermatophilus sp. SYSU D00691]
MSPPVPDDVALRPGRPEDAAVLARVHHAARAAGMPWLPDLHEEAETVGWMRGVVLPEQQVWVAERAGVVVGFAAVHEDWLEQLYVAPDAWGAGAGRALLEAARAARPEGLRLHVFARNERARRFYEAAGFVLVGTGDGSANEEGEPDCTYAWRPSGEVYG